MANIKLARLPDRRPVRLAFSISPELHRSLSGYADFYREAYGEAPPLPDLIPAMLEAFLAGDRAYLRWQRSRMRAGDEARAPGRGSCETAAERSETEQPPRRYLPHQA